MSVRSLSMVWQNRHRVCSATCAVAPRRGGLIALRVWRRHAERPHRVFAFSGAVDTATLCAIVQQVERMAQSAPGHWSVDVIAAQLERSLLRDLLAGMRALRRAGLRSRLHVASPPRARVRTAPPVPRSDAAGVFH